MSIKVTITERNNLVTVSETDVLVKVQEQTIAVFIGDQSSGGGGGAVTFAAVQAALAEASSAVAFNAQLLSGVADPVSAQDAVTLQYFNDHALVAADIATEEGGTITVLVAAVGGSDAPTVTRPAKLRAGDYSAEPFATVDGALACVPKLCKKVVVNVEAGTFAGYTLRGFGFGEVQVVGSWATPTLTSGATSGTAGAGSGATVLNKPTAAADWMAGELVGKLVRITGGGGDLGGDPFVENVLRIKSNTATQAVLEASMYGLDGTTQFSIVEEGTVFSSAAAESYSGASYVVGVLCTTADVRLTRLRVDNSGASALYGLVTGQTQYTDLVACGFTGAFVVPGYSSNLRMLSLHLAAGSYLYCYGQNVALVNGLVGEDSTAQFERFESLDASNVSMDGDVGYWNAIAILHGGIATLGGDLSNCTSATPLLVQNVRQFSIASALSGTNAAQTYGARVQGGGQFNLAGMTLAGNDASKVVRVEDAYNLSYAQISGNGCHQCKGTFVIGGGPATSVFLDDVQVISGQMYLYGVIRPLGNAYKEVTAHAGGGQASAMTAGYVGTKVTTCASDHDSVRLLGSGDLVITGGLQGYIINATAQIVDVYPPSGRKIYLGGVDQGVDAAVELLGMDRLDWASDDAGNYWIH